MASPFILPFLFPINHSGNKESANGATYSVPTDDFPRMPLSSTHPDPPIPPPRRSSLYNFCQVSFNAPPLIPSDSVVTHPLSLHLGSLDTGLPHVGLPGRGPGSSRTFMEGINRVSF